MHLRGIALACALIGAATPARAGGIVVESYTGARPADAEKRLRAIFEELSKRGYISGSTLALQVDGIASHPARTPQGLPFNFASDVDRGHRAWVAGDFQQAVGILSPLVTAARENPAELALDPKLRAPLQKALIVLALSEERVGDHAAAVGAFGELLRCQPDATVSRATYGPAAGTLFEAAKQELTASGRGKLVVKLADPGMSAFVDERFIGVGPVAAATDIIPGEYRVLVQQGSRLSRSHVVTVRANQDTVVSIDPSFDDIVHTTGWVGFEFAGDADRDRHEEPYAAQLANAIDTSAVIVVGVDQVRGHPAIVGAIVNLQTGRALRRASVSLEVEPSPEKLRALAAFLVGEPATDGLEVLPSRDAPGAADLRLAAHGGLWGGYKWLATGGAVAAFATGGVLLAYDGSCKKPATNGSLCAFTRNTTPAWVATMAGGAVIGAVAVYLWVRHDGSEPSHTAFVAPTDGGAVAGVVGRF